MKTVAVYSGGMDSTVLLLHLLAQGHQVEALSINYGQRHRLELEHAAEICGILGIKHQIADLTTLRPLLAGSSQTDDSVPVPHGHYEEESMKKTVVPNRNMILISIAGALAISTKADAVAYAAHGGDHAIYPDCREEFVQPLSVALWKADWHAVRLDRPFLTKTKADLAVLGAHYDQERIIAGLKPVLGLSYSCYEGKKIHCGLCGTCQERKEAFKLAGIADPTSYSA